MNNLVIISLAFRIIVTATITYYCYRIGKMVVTPTLTWLIMGSGFGLALIRLFVGAFFEWMIFNNILSLLSTIAFSVGIIKIYYDTKAKFKGKIPENKL